MNVCAVNCQDLGSIQCKVGEKNVKNTKSVFLTNSRSSVSQPKAALAFVGDGLTAPSAPVALGAVSYQEQTCQVTLCSPVALLTWALKQTRQVLVAKTWVVLWKPQTQCPLILAKLFEEAVSPALGMSNWTSMWLPAAAFSELCSSPSIRCFLCPLASSQPPSTTRLPLPEHLAFSIDMALQSLLFAQLTSGMPVTEEMAVEVYECTG